MRQPQIDGRCGQLIELCGQTGAQRSRNIGWMARLTDCRAHWTALELALPHPCLLRFAHRTPTSSPDAKRATPWAKSPPHPYERRLIVEEPVPRHCCAVYREIRWLLGCCPLARQVPGLGGATRHSYCARRAPDAASMSMHWCGQSSRPASTRHSNRYCRTATWSLRLSKSAISTRKTRRNVVGALARDFLYDRGAIARPLSKAPALDQQPP